MASKKKEGKTEKMNTTAIIKGYIKSDRADSLGVAVLPNGNAEPLALAVIPHAKTAEFLHIIADGKAIEDAHKGSGAKIRYNITKKTTAAALRLASKVYALPFTTADIENAYNTEKAKNGKQTDGGRGLIFEKWTIKALNGEGNAKQNASRTESGDARINGEDIQIKYNRASFALLK